jgi:putative hemolysin
MSLRTAFTAVLFYDWEIRPFDDDDPCTPWYAWLEYITRRCKVSRGIKILIGVVGALVVLFLIGAVLCTLLSAPVRSSEPESGEAGLPNPASVYCEEQGGSVEIRTDADGGQYGVCIFADGSECDEWAFYRGECSPRQ